VREFAKENKLTHPILLGGREAHRELYRCKYVPTNFWIDRTGRIVGAEEGFEPEHVDEMEQMIRNLLAP
jgi:hypothetical protein